MMGRVDWAKFTAKVYEAFDKKINNMLYTAVMTVDEKYPSGSQWVVSSPISKDTKEDLIELVEDVSAVNGGVETVIMGTRVALSKITACTDVNWISEKMKDERHTTGRLAIADGMKLVEIPQAFADNDTTTKMVDNTKLLIMPMVDNKFVKMYNEGDAQISEFTDGDTNKDKTISLEYQVKMGIATILQRKFGVWKITTA